MKIKINIEKKYVYFIFSLLILIIGVIGVDAYVDKTGPWHDDNSVEININNQIKSLQEAINDDDFTENWNAELKCTKKLVLYKEVNTFFCDTGFLMGGGAQFNTEREDGKFDIASGPVVTEGNKLAWHCYQENLDNNPSPDGKIASNAQCYAICCDFEIAQT